MESQLTTSPSNRRATAMPSALLPVAGGPTTATRRGRAITAADVVAARHVGMINETLARTYFGTSDPIGLTVHLKYLQRPPLALADDSIEIIGLTLIASPDGRARVQVSS